MATLEQKLPLLSSTMKNRYCIVSAVGFFHGQLHFLPRVWPVCESAGQGQIITLLLRPRPSAPLVRFQCETFPRPALPDWLLVSLLDRGQLKLGANCSLCWPSGPRRPQFRLICEVTPLENANSATVDRETLTIKFL